MLAKNTQFFMRKHNSVCQGLVLTQEPCLTLSRPGSFLLPATVKELGAPPTLKPLSLRKHPFLLALR